MKNYLPGSSKIYFQVLFLLFFSQPSLSQDYLNNLPQFVINEVQNGDLGIGDEYFELLYVGQRDQEGNLLPVSDVVLDNSLSKELNSSTDNRFISIKASCLQFLRPGDLILVYGEGAPTGINTGALTFSLSDPCIEQWNVSSSGGDPYLNATTYNSSNPLWKDFLQLNDQGDLAQVRVNSQRIQGLTINSKGNYSLSALNSNHTNLPPTAGLPNNALNAVDIDILTDCPEMNIECQVFEFGRIEILIEGGDAPFSGQIIGLEDVLFGFSLSGSLWAYNVPCGEHEIIVSDRFGCQETCQLTMQLEETNNIESCPGGFVEFSIPNCVASAPCYEWSPEHYFTGVDFSEPFSIPFYNDEIVTLTMSDGTGNVVGRIEYNITMSSLDSDGDGVCDPQDVSPNNTCFPNSSLQIGITGESESCGSSILSVGVGDHFAWSTGETTSEISVSTSGTYFVTVSDNDGCSGESSHQIEIHSDVNAIISGDTEICLEETSTLVAFGGDNYVWSTIENSSSIEVSQAGIYSVTVSNLSGCSSIASTEVFVGSGPDNDGDGVCAGNGPGEDPNDADPCDPNLSISVDGEFAVCLNSSTIIDLSIENGTAPFEITWVFGDGGTNVEVIDDVVWNKLTAEGYNLTRFEGNIPNVSSNHMVDLLFEKIDADGISLFKSVEMKNWISPQTILSGPGSQYYAYIQSGERFEYYFSDVVKEQMKTRFQGIYKNKFRARQLFLENPTYFTSQGIQNVDELHMLAINGGLVSHPTFMNFIK